MNPVGFLLPVIIAAVLSISCEKEEQVQFHVTGTSSVLLAKSREAQEGILNFSAPKRLEYRFNGFFTVPPDKSLMIAYEYNFPPPEDIKENYSLILNTGSASWELPMDFGNRLYHYLIPVNDSFNGHFYIEMESKEKINAEASLTAKAAAARAAAAIKSALAPKDALVFRIRFIDFNKRFFGFNMLDENKVHLSPFVYMKSDGSYVIDVPPSFWQDPSYIAFSTLFSPDKQAVLDIAGQKIENFSGTASIFLSTPALYSAEGKATLLAEEIKIFSIIPQKAPEKFPVPIYADPALVINWPKANWRDSNFEIFRWDRFPNVLIFDYADYDAQDRMLKRLAPDAEIADLHGWNAHDYRAEDLALFFDTARKINFPLLDEERQLEKILLEHAIIREELSSDGRQDGIVAGNGAVISITRESPDYLRYRFMVHEGFHGLFFIDEDFRNYSRNRWQQLPAPAKRFITSYFEYQQYDTRDEYLLVNEFMGHVLQQPVSGAADYFGRQLPQILESTWRASSLPQKDNASGTWPLLAQAFTAEAQAFSAYVNQKWGLAAGRVWMLRVR